jgi:hypothetical protein
MIIDQFYAGGKQLVYLAAVSNWQAVGKSILRKRGNVRPVYGFDLQSDYMNIGNMDIGGETWIPIWLSKYNDDLGSKIYQALSTGFPISKLGQFLTSGQFYSANLDFAPIIPGNNKTINADYAGESESPYLPASITWDAERLIYQMTINIAYPCLVLTSIPEDITTYCIGPVFLNNISYSVSDGSDVSIELKTKGVKYASAKSATYFNSTDITIPVENYANVYRSANFIDCYFDIISDTSILNSDSLRVVSMSLDVMQDFELQVTCASDIDNTGVRFIELKNRSVNGSVGFLAKSEYIDPMLSKEIIMYFGGPFYFRMRNIRWQNPTRAIAVDGENGGYLHTYSFVALADTEAKLNFKNNFNKPTCSEFYIGS